MYEGTLLKSKLQAGQICLGTWINFTDPTVAELLTESSFDFFIIDSEHSAMDIESVQLNIMATKGTQVAPMVRVPWNDPVLIKRVLDSGAAGVLVPLVRTANDVRNAISACMYPPRGNRGFGPRRPASYERHFNKYIETANDNIIVWAQIEHIDAVNNIEQIVQVPGLSGVFVGSCDLSGSMGLLGQTSHADVLGAIDKVIASAKAANIPTGIAGPAKPELANQWLEKGIQFITLGGDQGYLVHASQQAVNGLKKLREEKK
ncbi:MAG: aldolase/citrate lyase family protein [Planctomycetota bacterium]